MRRTVGINQALWLRSWKGEYHASKESLNLMCLTLTVSNRLSFQCHISVDIGGGRGGGRHIFVVPSLSCTLCLWCLVWLESSFTLHQHSLWYNLACTVFWVDLRGVHLVWGEPIYPLGQVHTGLWLTTLQLALGAQGLSTAHGLMHFLFLQDV
jgi:hypothetical protein